MDDLADALGVEMAGRLRDLSLAIYRAAADIAEPRGIIIADTKFEFGLRDGNLMLIDELLTPDSNADHRDHLHIAIARAPD